MKTSILVTLLSALPLSHAHAQPSISLHIQRRDFSGNLLRLTDGSFVAEKSGELFRLTPNARFDQRLAFDPTQPFLGVTGGQTEFERLLAPRHGGGFLAMVNFYVPGLGWIERRLARFDASGQMESSFDTSGTSIAAAVELSDNRLLYALAAAEGSALAPAVVVQYERWLNGTGIWGCARALALQGSNVIIGGNLVDLNGPPMAAEAKGLLRLDNALFPDTSFRPPNCKDIGQVAVQSDGRIIAVGRLTDSQGAFESEASVFRLNSDGSFERRFLQASPNGGQAPIFSVATNDEVLILNAGNFFRYHADGTLAQSGSGGIGNEKVELLPDGSFIGYWYNADAGGPEVGCQQHHWGKFRVDGQVDPNFPPNPLDDLYTIYLSVTNTISHHRYEVEQSSDFMVWRKTGASGYDGGNGSDRIEIYLGFCVRREQFIERQFFRLVEVPDF